MVHIYILNIVTTITCEEAKGQQPYCRGIVTADVLELGLSRGAIATRKLEEVMRDKEHEGLYWFGPLR